MFATKTLAALVLTDVAFSLVAGASAHQARAPSPRASVGASPQWRLSCTANSEI